MKKYFFVVFTITLSTSIYAEQDTTKTDQGEEATRSAKNIQNNPEITNKSICDKVMAYVYALCQNKGYEFSQIPENMLPEANERITLVLKKLATVMETHDRNFVYQDELEATTQNIFALFLSLVNYALISQMAQNLVNNLDFSAEKIRSSRMPISKELKEKINDNARLIIKKQTNIK